MARRKRKLEEIEALDRSETSKPQPLPPEAIEDIKRTINEAWARAKANPKVRNDEEGLQTLRGLVDAETNPDKREFHERIFGIATRLAHRKKPLSVSNDAAQSEQASDGPLPLHERIKFLRQS
jgi:hypothetical protein